MLSRSCGTCTACCVELTILKTSLRDEARTPFEKPAGTPCGYLCQAEQGSCGVYETRPGVCRSFACAWLEGLGSPFQHRPDQVGLLFIRRTRKQAAVPPWPVDVPQFQAFEHDAPGVDPMRREGWGMVHRISQFLPVVLLRGSEKLGYVCADETMCRKIEQVDPSLTRLTSSPWEAAGGER